jgi:hypothetical protein
VRRALIVALVLVGCGREDDSPAPVPASGSGPAPAPVRARGTFTADSTIAVRDYIGPAACGDCHPDQLARWRSSLHSTMNQRADAGRAALLGDFATSLSYAGGEIRFSLDGDGAGAGGAPAMTFSRPAAAGRAASTVRYRVTRTIGTRGLQEYVGVEDGGPGDEVRLPVAWWPRRGGWFPQPYFDPWLAEDALDLFAPVREPWAERCPWCHSTYPFEQRIARAAGRAVGHGLEQHFTAPPGGDRLDVARQVTVGISCESCHLGGRAHAAGAPIHFVPLGAAPRPSAPTSSSFARERRDPEIVGAVCAQCHSGPSPRFPDGAALRNSSESLDLAASPCTGIKCTDCHDPHRGGADPARAIAACTGCHAAVAARASGHAGDGHAAVTCLDCHMPRFVMGIDRYVRSHRISSPTAPAMLARAAPNACNLCHLDRSIRWTLDELALRHGVRVPPRVLAGYPDPDASVGDVWLASPQPGLRLVAATAYARSPLGRFAFKDLLRGLDDDLPYVRAWTQIAVEDVLGRRLAPAEYDPRAPRPARRARIERLATLLPRAR